MVKRSSLHFALKSIKQPLAATIKWGVTDPKNRFAAPRLSCYRAVMKFSVDNLADGNIINAYTDEKVMIAGQVYSNSLIVLPDRIIEDWPIATFEQLNAGAFETLAALEPDIIILGTGDRQQFPPPKLYQALIEAHIGLEVMNTAAACRTYNVLTSENRRVAAALIVGAKA
ncbi:MAG: Mth938-like domain-containing protein [Chromatiales bacterium]|nr:Mth938-like domain-containing protein [Chromatiales bacterium]